MNKRKERLDKLTIDSLITLECTKKKKCESDKIRCIIYWGLGYSWEEICEILFISSGTISSYVEIFKKYGIEALIEDSYGSNHYKLSVEEEEILCRYIENHNILNSQQACDFVKRRFGVKYSVNGMTQKLKKLGFSYRKPKRVPPVEDKPAQEAFVKDYYSQRLSQTEDEAIYFGDGAGFEHNSKLGYGWMRPGKDCKKIKANTGRKRINVNGAYNPETLEVIAVETEKTVTAKTNIALVKELIRANPAKSLITLILDNASVNHSTYLMKFIRRLKGRVRIIYLPTYSPKLNLIERIWRFIKHNLLCNAYFKTFIEFKDKLTWYFQRGLQKYRKKLKTLMKEIFDGFSHLAPKRFQY